MSVAPEDLKVNDIVVVKVGEKVPVDGVVAVAFTHLMVALSLRV
ncbi:hypothetical protein HpBGD70_14790 [Helicobacter pylori]